MIEMKNAGKSFSKRVGRSGRADFQAVSNVDLTVGDAEFITLLGPSGCGKTTLLRMIAGLAGRYDGEILVDGAPVTGPSPDRAVVFQSFALLPWANVLRNVAFGLELRGDDRASRESRSRDLIDLVGLTGFEHSLPWELSGGMQQRVGLARALAVEPSVMLMDEPFGALDEQTKRVMQDELLRIWQESPKAVIFVTHSIDEAILLGDRVVVMATKPGRILQIEDVNIPRPRTRESELSPEFVRLRQRLWMLLRDMQELPKATGGPGD